MHSLKDIPGIEETALELLEAAGFRDCESLARAGVDPLVRELERANEILQIAGTAPDREQVTRWIRAARGIIGEKNTEPSLVTVMPVNFEVMPEVASMLQYSPCAIPFPGRWLADSNITVAEIIPGILLNRYAGDLEVRIEDRMPTSNPVSKTPANQYVQVAEKPPIGRLDIDVSRLRNFEQFTASTQVPQSAARIERPLAHMSPDAIDLVIQALPETNVGKDRNSRRYIRGVLHSSPWSVRSAALITLLLIGLLPVAIAVSPLLVLSDGDPESYHWVRPWWVVFPFLVPVLGLAWLVWGYSCSCRICRQKLFVPGKHRKNAKAHRIPLLGYILPLIFHLMIFQWFRCTHCGTPVRLKK
jgi:hypothetical protein